MARIRGKNIPQVEAQLELEHLDTPVERTPIIPAQELMAPAGTHEKSLLGNYGSLAAPGALTTPEATAETRPGASPIAQALIDQEVKATDRFRQTPLESIAINQEGQESPSTLMQNANARIKELENTPRIKSNESGTIFGSGPDFMTPTGAENLFLRGTELIEDLWSMDNFIEYDDGEKLYRQQFIKSSLGEGASRRMMGVASLAGMLSAINDPALRALQERPSENYKQDEKKRKLDISEFKNVRDVKQKAFPVDAEGNLGSIDPKAYNIIYAAGNQGMEAAREILGVEAAKPSPYVDPEDDYADTVGLANRQGDAEAAEGIMQHLLDKNLIKILGYKDQATGRTRYYPSLTARGESLLPAINAMMEATVPAKNQMKRMSRVQTDFRGTVGEQPKSKTEVEKLTETEAPKADQVYLSILGGVGVVPEEAIVNLLGQVNELVDKGTGRAREVAREYVKLSIADVDKTRTKVYETQRNKMMSQLMAKVDKGFLTEEQAQQQAHNFATEEAAEHESRLIGQEKSKRDRELEMMNDILTDPDGSLVRFIEWGLGRNKRAQSQSRDGQMESKAFLRAGLGFADKSRIDRARDHSPAALKKDARRMFDAIFKAPGKSRDGWDALKAWQSIPEADREAMALNAIYARTFIQLKLPGSGTYQSSFYGKELPINTRRMTPPDFLDFFAQNRDVIMRDLADIGFEVQNWIQNGINPESPYFEMLFKRGEAGFFISTALDAANALSDTTGYYESMARIDIDSNNSNVGLHALKSGNLGELATLGFLIDADEVGPWFDTRNNPDSFYDVLAGGFADATREIFEKDEDRKNAMLTFFDDTINKNKDNKTWSRAQVVHGFYGLHPIVNTDAVKEILVLYRKEADLLKKAFGDDETKMINALKAVRGKTYDETLGNVSQTKIVNNALAALTFFGDQAPSIVTDTGAVIDFGIGELMPSYMKQTVFDGTGLKQTPDVNYVRDKDGNLDVELRRQQRYDYEVGRVQYNEDGTITDLTKPNGMAIGDSGSATLTHTTDAAAEKIAIIAQNAERAAKGLGPLPNIPIHDANILNSKSYVDHWIAYNMIALPALAKERGTFLQVFDAANKMHDDLKKYEVSKRRKKQKINVGTGQGSKHRSIFGVLNYWDNRLNGKGLDVPQSEEQKSRSAKKEARFKELLKQAEKSGFKPKRTHGPEETETILVEPEDFMHLVNIAYELLGIRHKDGRKTGLQRKVQSIKSLQDNMIDALESGNFIGNTQN